jgi:TPR repeat protein
MALIQCPECGKTFSDKADACPNCAYPLTELDRIRLGVTDTGAALKKADNYYGDGRYSLAFEIYDAVASLGNKEAFFKAGSMLCNGYGVDADINKGITYLKKSANENYPDAMFFLGCIYDSNEDKENAVIYFEKSFDNLSLFNESEQGHIYYRLGALLPNSEYERKINYLNTAVEMGISNGEEELGKLYSYLGNKYFDLKDIPTAVKYFEQAAECGNEAVKALLGDCYYSLALEEKTNEEKIRFLRKATKAGNKKAMSLLGKYYLDEGEAKRDIKSLEKASDLGNEEAINKLSVFYNSKGAEYYKENNLSKAKDCFVKAADLGDESAKKNLAVLYNRAGVSFYQGNKNFAPDYIKAEENFKLAVEFGNEDAKENLGILYNQYGDQYYKGNKVIKNYETAQEFYIKAVKMGNEAAKKSLIMVYVNSYFNYKHGINGYVRDSVKANNYLSKARQVSPEILEQIAQDYHSKAQELTAKGITHHNYKVVNSCLKKSARLGKNDLTKELVDFYKTVAHCYKKGINGFDKDKRRENYYFKKAAELGDEEAIKKYRSSKGHKNIVKTAFEAITGTSTDVLQKAKNKGNYNYYYKDYND